MKTKNIILGAGIIIILLIGAYLLGTKNNVQQTEETNGNVSTTTNSENGGVNNATNSTTKKPTVKTPAVSYSNNYIWIGKEVLINGVYVTPNKVAYDSRCPRDVQCIQAGTVDLGVLLVSGNLSQNTIITLNKPFSFAGKIVTLTSVMPSKVSTKTLNESDYRFLITVKK